MSTENINVDISLNDDNEKNTQNTDNTSIERNQSCSSDINQITSNPETLYESNSNDNLQGK